MMLILNCRWIKSHILVKTARDGVGSVNLWIGVREHPQVLLYAIVDDKKEASAVDSPTNSGK